MLNCKGKECIRRAKKGGDFIRERYGVEYLREIGRRGGIETQRRARLTRKKAA